MINLLDHFKYLSGERYASVSIRRRNSFYSRTSSPRYLKPFGGYLFPNEEEDSRERLLSLYS